MDIVIKEPLLLFLRRLAPEPRRALRKALKDLRDEKGDIRSLDESLSGYYRLRVGRYRVILRYRDEKTIDAVFAEQRSLVYDVFEEQFLRRLKSRTGGKE